MSAVCSDLSRQQAQGFSKEQEEAAQRLQRCVSSGALPIVLSLITFMFSLQTPKSVCADINSDCCVGPRTAKGIADALTSALPASQINKIKDTLSYSNFTTASTLPKVVLFTDKPKTSALYKSLSLQFKGRLAFAEVSSRASDVIQQQEVTQFPKLVVLRGDNEVEEYSGLLCLSCWLQYSLFGPGTVHQCR